jgi:uncharacterized membrane protein YhaH (DUF805 family)
MKKFSKINNNIRITVFIVSFVLAIYIVFSLFSNPLRPTNSSAYIYLLILFAICVNLGLGILRNITNFSQNKWVFYTFQWVLTIVMPIVLILLIEHPLQKKIMWEVSDRMNPVIKYIDSYVKQNSKLPEIIQFDTSKIDSFGYYRKDKSYMVKTIVLSLDADGETIYYDSKDRKWYRFHHDQFAYFKDKKIIPKNIKNYLWFIEK